MAFRSIKLVDGFSTCFRQFKATETRCALLHGYSISFRLTFEGNLDHRQWVIDFGFLKRSKTQVALPGGGRGSLHDWFHDVFDHTVVLAQDDPALAAFGKLAEQGFLTLRVLPAVGCERFAEFVFTMLDQFLDEEVGSRVQIISVECFEHERNSALYVRDRVAWDGRVG